MNVETLSNTLNRGTGLAYIEKLTKRLVVLELETLSKRLAAVKTWRLLDVLADKKERGNLTHFAKHLPTLGFALQTNQ